MPSDIHIHVCAVLLCLVCLFDLAYFLLSSSFKNMYIVDPRLSSCNGTEPLVHVDTSWHK